MAIAHAVMGLLTRGARYGYEIRRELETEFGPEWRIDFGQLYRLLGTIERKGWVRARHMAGEQGPARRVFRLTRRGRAEFQHWLQLPDDSPAHGRDELPLKLRFGLAERRAAMDAAIAGRQDTLQARRRRQHERSEAARRGGDAGAWLVAEAQLQRTDAALTWLRSCRALSPAAQPSSTAIGDEPKLIAVGSDDPVLDLLLHRASEQHPEMRWSSTPAGSIAGLIALRGRQADLAGVHLLDVDSGQYNVPFIKHVLPEEPIMLVHLAQREQGLMVAAGNPKEIRSVCDLARRGVRFINRQRGAGTRLLLHHRLRAARIETQSVLGYTHEVPTHNAVAAAISAGVADVGPGIRAVAQAWGLAFIPLGYERYELAMPRTVFTSKRLEPVLEVMHQAEFRQAAARFSGYDLSAMSTIVAELH